MPISLKIEGKLMWSTWHMVANSLNGDFHIPNYPDPIAGPIDNYVQPGAQQKLWDWSDKYKL